jgi:flavin-dependent dehydrogenase
VTYRPVHSQSTGQITCRFIVDASGQHALIAKQLGLRVVDQSFRFMSLWGYFENSKYIGLDGKAYPFEALSTIPPTTFISSIPKSGDWGWVWHIPLRGRSSVGLVLPIESTKAAKASGESWQSYYLRQCAEIPYLNQLLQDAQFCAGSLAKVHDYSYRSTQVAGSGFFLIGDAAGFIDPIFSAGVILGMYSAYLAAWAIDRSLKKPAEAAHYQDIFSNQLQGRLEVTRSLSLPGYQLKGQISHLAKNTVSFESALEQQLMDAASQMTTRGDNFARLAGHGENEAVASKLRVLEELVF